MELAETDDPSDLYGKEEDAVKSEYRQRDTNVVEFLKANPEIRQYVEKRMGATVEEVWNIKDVLQGEQQMRIVYRGGHFMEKIVAKRLVR